MSRPLIRNAPARRYFLAAQGLSSPPRRKLTRSGLQRLIEQLGYVQVDSINTVERAHHLILFARNQTYSHRQLAHLLERDATLFENWTHDAAIIPSNFYRFWSHRFALERDALRTRWRKWRRNGFEEMLDEVRARIKEYGPIMARQLASDEPKNASGWWDWHPSKTALEFLWRTGDLAVARREGFQKVYDLAERVIPSCYRGEPPSPAEFIDWACREALARLGFASPGDLASFWGGVSASEAAAWCQAASGGDVIEVLVEAANGSGPKLAYALRDFPEHAARAPTPPGQLRVLSPFDPVIRNRNRTEQIFDFRYRIEVFVPEAKREYGYYVFPLLERDRFVGRIDMRHMRQEGILKVSGLWLEPRFKFTAQRRDKLDAELARLGTFIDADRVVFEDGFLKSDT